VAQISEQRLISLITASRQAGRFTCRIQTNPLNSCQFDFWSAGSRGSFDTIIDSREKKSLTYAPETS
jgi:hypothetical protein